MLEIEAKAKVDDLERIKERILAMGGSRIGNESHIDTYFNHPSRDFRETDEALRIRDDGKGFFLAYKGPKLDALTKTREEIEIKIANPEGFTELLKKMGFREVATVKKRREVFELGGYTVMLDCVRKLGNFIEVEKHGEEYEERELVDFLKRLGIAGKAMERRSYLELLLEKGKR